ncbi:MAG: hypothetical protein WC356_04720 [Candidatus Micrarchaeia archaeon]
MNNCIKKINNLKSLCYICNKPATTFCKLCGKPICAEHEKNGVCIICIKGRVMKN